MLTVFQLILKHRKVDFDTETSSKMVLTICFQKCQKAQTFVYFVAYDVVQISQQVIQIFII